VYHDALICSLTTVEKILDVDRPQFSNYRSLLRSGPAASLRVNIRAVSQLLALFILYLIACETFFIPGEFS